MFECLNFKEVNFLFFFQILHVFFQCLLYAAELKAVRMFVKLDVDFIYNVMALSFSSKVHNHTSIFCQACGTFLISLFHICGFLTEKLLQYQIFGDRKVMCRQHMLNVKHANKEHNTELAG